MDRSLGLTCFYFGIFCTLFFSTNTISVYTPKHIIDEIMNLTERLKRQIPNEIEELFLNTPLESYWEHHKACLKTYLTIFEVELKNVSKVSTHPMQSTIKHINNCIEVLKERCKKIKGEGDHIPKCENKTSERNVYVFIDYFLDFSKFLNRDNLCSNTVLYNMDESHHNC